MAHDTFRRAMIGGAFAASLVAFFYLPGALPRSWGLPPAAGAWVSRALSAFFLPSVAAVIGLMFSRLAPLDPYRGGTAAFQSAYPVIVNTAIVFILGLHAVLLAALLLGPVAWLGTVLPLLFGGALVVAGNVLPRLRPNLAVGVRTPWTLADRQVWARVHRAGGYLVVGLGLLVIAAALVAPALLPWIAGAGMATIVLALGVLSRFVAAQHRGTGSNQAPTKGRQS